MSTAPRLWGNTFWVLLVVAAGGCGAAGGGGGGVAGRGGSGAPGGSGSPAGGAGGNAGAAMMGAGGSSRGGTGEMVAGGSSGGGSAGTTGASGTGDGGGSGRGGREGGAGAMAGAGGSTGGAFGGGAGAGGSGAAGRGGGTGTCVASKSAGSSMTGSGPHKVTVETNASPGINEGTIFRPTDLGGTEKYPIFVWGEGACSKNGLSNATAMAEIASHGYFVVADGTPNGTGGRTQDRANLRGMAAPLIAYIDWAIAENDKPCSAYYQSLDAAKIAANGFSCGGLMSQAMVFDPRVVTWGVTSSGMKGAPADYFDLVKTPVLFVEGGPSDIAYEGAVSGYTAIAKLTVPVMWFSKDIGHGGDLGQARGGDFTKINLAWLNWWLKGDQTATGKGLLVGASCPYCSNAAWEYKSTNVL